MVECIEAARLAFQAMEGVMGVEHTSLARKMVVGVSSTPLSHVSSEGGVWGCPGNEKGEVGGHVELQHDKEGIPPPGHIKIDVQRDKEGIPPPGHIEMGVQHDKEGIPPPGHVEMGCST